MTVRVTVAGAEVATPSVTAYVKLVCPDSARTVATRDCPFATSDRSPNAESASPEIDPGSMDRTSFLLGS